MGQDQGQHGQVFQQAAERVEPQGRGDQRQAQGVARHQQQLQDRGGFGPPVAQQGKAEGGVSKASGFGEDHGEGCGQVDLRQVTRRWRQQAEGCRGQPECCEAQADQWFQQVKPRLPQVLRACGAGLQELDEGAGFVAQGLPARRRGVGQHALVQLRDRGGRDRAEPQRIADLAQAAGERAAGCAARARCGRPSQLCVARSRPVWLTVCGPPMS